ncbi:MAG: phosphoribosylglycinamide formyltransferase 1, partial [Micavibrio sp.]|nr:phosphoribosylglycinamide formyltransferase 1 [Micavibrio sp.]
IRACADPEFPAEIIAVISNKADAPGLEKAEKLGIKTLRIDQRNYTGRSGFENALNKALIHNQIELICLAGFMKILSPEFVNSWTDRIINIHPSLLPEYPGLDTYTRAIADKKPESGCTVHYVIPEMDAGPVILQRRVPVEPGDTADTLAARILVEEHIAYPEAVKIVAEKLLNSGTIRR